MSWTNSSYLWFQVFHCNAVLVWVYCCMEVTWILSEQLPINFSLDLVALIFVMHGEELWRFFFLIPSRILLEYEDMLQQFIGFEKVLLLLLHVFKHFTNMFWHVNQHIATWCRIWYPQNTLFKHQNLYSQIYPCDTLLMTSSELELDWSLIASFVIYPKVYIPVI